MISHIRPILTVALLGSLVFLGSCKSDSINGGENNFDRAAMLSNYGNNTILPAYLNLQDATVSLETSADAFIEDPTESTLSILQSDLKAARLAWQEANIFQFGPAESVTLRASLNTYPADTSQIKSNIESGDYTLGTIENRAAVGFPALDFLLHGIGESNQEIVSIYSEGELAASFQAYLQDNITFIKQKVDDTATEWSADGGNYLATFLSEENAGTDVGSSLGMLINATVLHYERFFRDGKIGIPAGVRSAGVRRPVATEAHFGGYSLELALANLEAIQRLFKGAGIDGSQDVGLEENLEALDAAELSTEINTEIDQAVTALEELNDPLSGQIESDNEPVLNTFKELQDIVRLLKVDMTSVLGVTITYQDNDGD
ncbi:imelysin family protein [Aliifodinibius sp. S!AR15-10]|uniref:imelysin family protein n=1 Tax=Aliifodinibius sp. S!AR15-10 TaxID=2950437 RepID=UPI0028650239|nr:imelysin family protein [Aliifodinibius sp. S!AR15-10]MDR8392495.1 imelysin family protein [Aliifodinibius sp. S!AR15-10]